jgi:hypothetical protein
MKETTERSLSSSTSASVMKLEEIMAKDGWYPISCRSVTVIKFEREIPDLSNPRPQKTWENTIKEDDLPIEDLQREINPNDLSRHPMSP